jgi:hypothetical protein
MDYMLEGLTADLVMAYPVYTVVYVCDLGVIPQSVVNSTETRAWARDREGVYRADFEVSGTAVRLKPPLREYDPTEHAWEILRDATALDLADEFAILAFLNRWGLLGVAEPENEVQIWDPAWQTKDQIREVQRLGGWLSALKEQRWRDSAISSNMPERELPRNRKAWKDRSLLAWKVFAEELNGSLANVPVRLAILPSGLSRRREVKQCFLPRCLLDLLYITLWQIATEDDTVLRRCQSCKGLFSVARTNRKRVYCTRTCKNRITVRRHRERKRRRCAPAMAPRRSTRP